MPSAHHEDVHNQQAANIAPSWVVGITPSKKRRGTETATDSEEKLTGEM